MEKINILIVDDESLLRQRLRTMLEKEIFVNSVYEAADESESVHQLNNHRIDLLLLDIRLRTSTGFELMQKLAAIKKEPKIIAVTGLDGIETIINLLKAGVHGIVYKLDGYSEIQKAIKAVMGAGTYFPENILRIIQSNSHRWNQVHLVTLSQPDKLLLKAIACGFTTKEIADELKMSPATAETYRVRLLRKVGVSNTAGLLAYAFRNGIL